MKKNKTHTFKCNSCTGSRCPFSEKQMKKLADSSQCKFYATSSQWKVPMLYSILNSNNGPTKLAELLRRHKMLFRETSRYPHFELTF